MVTFGKTGTRKKLVITLIVAVVLLIVAILILSFYLGLTFHDDKVKGEGAIVANGLECAAIGSSILKKQGTVADAAIATLFCEGVTCPQSMGLGGGFVLTIYTKSTGKVETLMARETAPNAATEDMFVNNPTESLYGGKASGVPGELKGYWSLHKRYGKLPWASLIQPTIDLCRKGHRVSAYLARILDTKKDDIFNGHGLKEIYVNPITNQTWKQNDIIKRLKLAETLEIIAKEGENALYNGTLTDGFIKDIQDLNGIITKEDLLQYKVRWEEPVTTTLPNDYKLYTTPLPTSGAILVFMLNILKGFLPDRSINSYQRLVETMKFGYGYRTQLGDKYFIEPSIEPIMKNLTDPIFANYIRSIIFDNKTFNDFGHYGANTSIREEHGTAHISIIGPNGDAIAVTSTINNIFGSKCRSESTGIILNDEMDDFTYPGAHSTSGLPPNPANFIKPGKRPLSAMVPTIITDKNGDVQLIIGGAGGLKILSSVAYTIIEHLWYKENITNAFNVKRLHHQLSPMVLQHENGFNATIINGLLEKGHVMLESSPDAGFAALTAISKENDHFKPIFDLRRGGSTDIFTIT